MMSEIVLSRKERLEAAEKVISAGMEEFYRVGMKLKEVRDDELYKEAGYTTWEDYCRLRWDWSRDYTYKLMRAAEYRAVLPDVDTKSTNKNKGWTEATVREMTRLPDKRTATRVGAKIIKAVNDSEKQAARDDNVKPLKFTKATVRKFVDEELGIDHSKEAREARKLERTHTVTDTVRAWTRRAIDWAEQLQQITPYIDQFDGEQIVAENWDNAKKALIEKLDAFKPQPPGSRRRQI
jgi:hypothetical protein